MKRYIIRISGRVQGVFFRASTKDTADLLGISGIVRNESNGSVYVEAEGADDALQQFVEWCKKGPPSARIVTFEIEESNPKGYVGFNIQRQ